MKKNILIFPSGTEIAFEILNALKNTKFYNIFGGTSVDDHSKYVYKNYIEGIPFVTDDDFVEKMNEIIELNHIDYIYPAHDVVIEHLANLMDEINTQIVTSPPETVRILRSKETTYDFFAEYDFVPQYYSAVDEVKSYPVFIKPKKGQGSNGAQRIDSKADLIQSFHETMIICEYLQGAEYTIDCFSDKNRKLRSVLMRDRARIRTGISVRSNTLVCPEEVEKIANIINNSLDFNGAWFFQLKQTETGQYKLLEISPRIPGTMACTRMKGINYPLLTLYNMQNCEVSMAPNLYEVQLDRAFINRYSLGITYKTIYVDLDDTLVLDGRVNYNLLTLLYQNREKGNRNILISRHAKNISETLYRYAISENLFDEIIHIQSNEPKSQFMNHVNSIFIDDSFKERLDVQTNCKIPVFDVDMIESLLDWR